MSLFRTIDRTSAVSNPAHARPLLTFLYPALCVESPRRNFSKNAINCSPKLPSAPGKCMDNWFIQALVRAASCPEHARKISTLRDGAPFTITHHRARRKTALQNRDRRQFQSTKTERTSPFRRVTQFAEKELKALVDYYGIHLAAESHEEVPDDGPLIWNVGDDHEPWPMRNVGDTDTITKLKELLENEESPHEDVFDTYKLLPAPGVVYLRTQTIRKLLHHLSVVERPTPIAMRRFLTILDDMKTAHIHITQSEWTTAIWLTSRFMGKVSDDEVQSALHLWRDMEKRAGVLAGPVTLNVLFDTAVKAGKYTLAENFLKEMHARKFKLHRHFRVSLLYYYGVLQDGQAVRRTYYSMVEAGDIIDTVVMNAVIAALIRAGEPASAEHVFERMKRLNASKSMSFPGNKPFNNRNWRSRRQLGLHLTHEGRQLTKDQDLEKRKELQDWAPIEPNSHTYSLLIRHYASTAGNLDRVNELLREMGYNGVPLSGSIFIVMFHAFNTFGGVRYTSWTADRLEQTWEEYLLAVRNKLESTWISRMAVVAALKAFKKCTDGERTLRAWEEVRELWGPEREEEESVLRVLGRLVPQGAFFDRRM